MTLDGLKSGNIHPNSGNGRDHIFKVITGAGKHSLKGAVLKPAIHNMLKEMNYEHYAELNNGVFLVRLRKWEDIWVGGSNQNSKKKNTICSWKR